MVMFKRWIGAVLTNRGCNHTRPSQNAMDFKEAAKALAEREKNRKWWEL